MAYATIILVLVAVVCQSQWSMPANAAVLVGSTATFTCQTHSSEVCWTYRQNVSEAGAPDDVCREGSRNKFTDRCNVSRRRTDGTYTLTINNVQLSDAGFYSCEDCFDLLIATTHLLVLGKIFL